MMIVMKGVCCGRTGWDGCWLLHNHAPLLRLCLQVFVLAVFFHKTVSNPATAAAGLFSAVLGLVLFLDGLRLAVMPMAMQVTQLIDSMLLAPASARNK